MSSNLFRRLQALFPAAPLLVGTVTDTSGGTATIELLDGGVIQARGDAAVSDQVFVRDGVIEGPAPALTLEIIEI